MNRYFGKYRGKVEKNEDPLQQGRIQISVPSVLGDGKQSWAMPCVPYAGPGVGFFAIPPVGASIWVEFEGGDLNYPIWTGCFWQFGEAPVLGALPEMKVWKTDCITFTLSDMDSSGGLTIEVKRPAVTSDLKATFNANGIELTCGSSSVKLGPTLLSLNNGALEVT